MKLAEHATFNDALSQCLKICIYKISFWNETLNEIYGNIFVVLERRGGNIFNVIQFTKFLNVTFYFAVSRARILGDRDVLVQVGSDINLTCRAEESPDVPETVTWYKNEQRVDNLLARGGISVVTESRRRSSNLLVSKVIQTI